MRSWLFAFIMGSKQKQTTTQANNYQYYTPPVTPQITAAEATAKSLKDKINPMIRSQFAGQRDQLNSQFQNPLGAHTTQAMRDATLNAGNENLNQNEALALTNAEYMANQSDFERQMAIAGMTAPQLVNTGGTSTQVSSPGVMGLLTAFSGGAGQGAAS